MIDVLPALPAAMIAVLAWLVQHLLNRQPFMFPDELLKAARAVGGAAAKWEQVGDAFLSWHLPVVFALGAVVAWALFRQKK